MTISAFLRGVRFSHASPWVLEYRHAEGGPWFVVDRLGSQEGVEDWVLSPSVTLDHGDLVRLLSPEGEVEGFWVQGLSGLLGASQVPVVLGRHRWDWEAAWEGPQAKADDLLWTSERVDRKRRVGAACDCAETALRFVPESESRPGEVIEVVRRWMRDEAAPEEVKRVAVKATDAASDAASAAAADPAAAASYAASYAAYYAAATSFTADCTSAFAAAFHAASASASASAPDGSLAVQRALSSLVRLWIPLPVVLLARAGEPTPLDPSNVARV